MAVEVYTHISSETMDEHEWVKHEDHLAEMMHASLMYGSMRDRCAAMERAFMASERLRTYDYLPWSEAGGLKECTHGVAEGINCRKCDLEIVKAQSLT